jgi:hypothetical protein
MNREITVGYYGTDYPIQRLIIDKWMEAEYVHLNRYCDFSYMTARALKELFKNNEMIRNVNRRKKFYIHSIKEQCCGVIHSFDSVVLTKKKWIVSFENLFPN